MKVLKSSTLFLTDQYDELSRIVCLPKQVKRHHFKKPLSPLPAVLCYLPSVIITTCSARSVLSVLCRFSNPCGHQKRTRKELGHPGSPAHSTLVLRVSVLGSSDSGRHILQERALEAGTPIPSDALRKGTKHLLSG